MENNILIVVDMQEDFITGSLANPEAQKIVDKVAKCAKNFKGKVIYTLDTHYDNYLKTLEGKKLPIEHCIVGTKGHELDPKIITNVNNDSIFIRKNSFGYRIWEDLFFNNNINVIKDLHIYIVGICTDICVISNALVLKTLFPEVPITVYGDLCAGTTIDNHNAALKVMNSCQIEIDTYEKGED